MKYQSKKLYQMVLTAIFAAVIIMMAFVPWLGFINLIIINATLIHIPVIIGSIVLGPKKGMFLGFIFGLCSFLNSTFNPGLTSFLFSPFYPGGNGYSLLICFLPRILVGVIPYYAYKGMVRVMKKKETNSIPLGVAGIVGSLTNTLLVMNLAYVLFSHEFATVKGVAVDVLYGVILGIIVTNGIPEAIVAAILTIGIGKVLLKLRRM